MSRESARLVLEPDAAARLERTGIRYPDHGLARDPEEAVAISERIGYPVVMKVVSADVPHKSDVGGVKVGLGDANSVRTGFRQIQERVTSLVPDADIKGILVCRQSSPGPEMIVGASKDPVFGMIMMCGLGGIFTEILKDVSFRALPLSREDAEEMLRELKGYAVLQGARGQVTCGVDRIADFLESVARFVADNPRMSELDLNPVRLQADGVEVLDVRMIEFA